MVKYYLFIVNNKKSILLSKSNTKTELREQALERIGDKITKYNNLYLYRVKISKVTKKEIEEDRLNKIKLIGGPYVATIQKILIKNLDDKTRLKNIDDNSNRVYFSIKHFKEDSTIRAITNDLVSKLVFDWVNDKFNKGLFAVNVI
jgi:hypothetical protein